MTMLQQFHADRRGNVAVIFGLSLVPMVLTAGGAADYALAIQKKSAIQRAMDSGVLAAAINGKQTSDYLQNIVNANLRGEKITVSNAAIATATAADGSVIYKGDASFAVRTNFLRGFGFPSINVSAHAEAALPAQIVTVTFTPTNTSGAYSKDIFIWTKDASGALTSRQTVLTYRYDSATGSKVTTPPIGSQTVTFSVPLYATYGLGMVVYQDYTNYSGALINPVESWSDGPSASAYLKQAGLCSSSTGATYNWEDGGDSNYQDFVYTMRCTTGVVSGTVARLSK